MTSPSVQPGTSGGRDTERKRLLERGPNGKPSHPYKSAAETNITATFARIRREQARAPTATVTPIKRGAQ